MNLNRLLFSGLVLFITCFSSPAVCEVSQSNNFKKPSKPLQLISLSKIQFFKKRMLLESWSFLDGPNDGVGSGFRLEVEGYLPLASDLSFHFGVLTRLSTSRVQESLDIYSPNSNLILKEASLGYDLSYFQFRLGSINQSYWQHSIVISEVPAVGLSAKFLLDGDVAFKIGASIPPSYSSNLNRIRSEGSPYFYATALDWKWKRKKLSFDSSLALFSYKNLPDVVAYESGLRGNRVEDGSSKRATFPYDFSGWSYKASYCQWMLCLRGNWILNEKAPQLEGRAQVLSFSVTSNIFGKWTYSKFFLDSNAVPALYGPWKYGFSDKKGHSLSILKKIHTQLKAKIDYTSGTGSLDSKYKNFNASLIWSF